MQPATEETVLGDFEDRVVDHRGQAWRFFRRDGKFFVHAEGPEGALHDYAVRFTFGVAPLQQYLVAFPGGRMQALPFAWDRMARRWFFLYPDAEISPADWLHWTRGGQNWNGMCADCHSTHVEKSYDADADVFHTTSSEISVGCEACSTRRRTTCTRASSTAERARRRNAPRATCPVGLTWWCTFDETTRFAYPSPSSLRSQVRQTRVGRKAAMRTGPRPGSRLLTSGGTKIDRSTRTGGRSWPPADKA
jgi:hypothetical protein